MKDEKDLAELTENCYLVQNCTLNARLTKKKKEKPSQFRLLSTKSATQT